MIAVGVLVCVGLVLRFDNRVDDLVGNSVGVRVGGEEERGWRRLVCLSRYVY